MNRWRRRTLATLTAALTLASSAVLAHPGLAAGADAPSLLKLEAARQSVTAYSYEGETYVDLGIYAVAGNRPFEVRSYRFDYGQPISAWRVQPGADTPLPSGLVTDFDGLSKFFSLTIKDAAGKTVVSQAPTFCPNGYQPVRRRPDAPATSPYPNGCDGNPYSLGGVYGIQRGYATPALNYLEVPLAPGNYSAVLAIRPAYRSALGIADADSTAAVQLKVVEYTDPDLAAARTAAARRVGADGRPSTAPAAPAAPAALVGKAIAPTGPLPDLRTLPAWGINVEDGRYLNFSATVWNGGPGRLVVDGFRRDDDENVMDAYQYFFDAKGKQVGYAPVGTMEWDSRDGHEHWHFTDFATYQLLDANKKFVLRSQKEAFCLAATDMVDYTVPGANWKPDNTDLSSACGYETSVAIREVLDAGSGDTYLQYLPGQSFDLKGLKNGVYYILVGANPDRKLSEASTSNNTSYRRITIGGSTGHRTVEVDQVGIVVEPPLEDMDH